MINLKKCGDCTIFKEDNTEESYISSFMENVNDYVCPEYYSKGEFETIKVIEDILDNYGYTGKECYRVGNILKYIIRANYKNGIEDLKKARNYLNWLIDDFKKRQ